MIEKFTFDVQKGKIQVKIILVKGDSETRGHVVLKLLAYMFYYQLGLKIEAAVDMHYKPDLVVMSSEGRPQLWIDCGHVAIKKMESLLRKLKQTQMVLVKKSKHEAQMFHAQLLKQIEPTERLQYLSFETGFIECIASSLQKVNEMTFYDVKENIIGVIINGNIFETEIFRWNH